MNKRMIITITLIFSFLITSVLATWIIIKQVNSEFPSDYFPFEVIDNQEVYYNGEEQGIDLDFYEDINVENYILNVVYYKVIVDEQKKYSLEDITTNAPINQGTYLAKIHRVDVEGNLVDEEISSVKFVIKSRKIKIVPASYSVYFGQNLDYKEFVNESIYGCTLNTNEKFEYYYEFENEVNNEIRGLVAKHTIALSQNAKISFVDNENQAYTLYSGIGSYNVMFENNSFEIIDNNGDSQLDNYVLEYDFYGTLTVNALPLSFTWDESSLVTTYNGDPQKPTVTFTTTVEGVTDEVFDKSEVNVVTNYDNEAGISTLINVSSCTDMNFVRLDNTNYTLSSSFTPSVISFKIEPKPISISWSNYEGLTYTGNQQIPIATVIGSQPDVLKPVVSLKEGDGISVGEHKVEANINNNNYIITQGKELDYSISDLQIELIWDIDNLVYTGNELNFVSVANEGIECEVYYEITNYIPFIENTKSNNQVLNAGTYTIKITGLSNDYSINTNQELEKDITVNQATPTFSKDPSVSDIFEGQDLDITDGEANVNGTFGFKSNETPSIIFTPGISTQYDEKIAKVVFTPTIINNCRNNYETVVFDCKYNIKAVASVGYNGKYYGTVYSAISAANVNGGNVYIMSCTQIGYTDYIITLTESITVNSNVNLILPYSNVQLDDKTHNENEASYNKNNDIIYSRLYIPKNVILTVNGQLNVTSNVYHSGSVGERGVILNDGSIIAQNGTINAYGYISGVGTLKLISSNLNDVFKIHEWCGGMNGMGLANNKVVPFTVYSFNNVSCDTIIDSSSNYSSLALLDVTLIGLVTQRVTIIGEGGLFELSTGTVIKSVEDTSEIDTNMDTFNAQNQSITQRCVVTVDGNVEDNSISIEKKAFGYGISIVTGEDFPMPVGFMRIIANSGKIHIKTNSYKFLPGSELYIGENAELEIDNGISVVFYDDYPENYTYTDDKGKQHYSGSNISFGYYKLHSDWIKTASDKFGAQFTVDGKLTSNGYIAGNINSNCNNAEIYLKNSNATIVEISSLTYKQGMSGSTVTTNNPEYIANGIIDNLENQQFSPNVKYYYDNNKGSWGTPITVNFVTNTQTPSMVSEITVLAGSSGFDVIEYLNSYNIYNEHYEFGGWYFDSEFTDGNKCDGIVNNSCTLYAKWNLISHNVTFNPSEGLLEDITTKVVYEGQKYGDLPIPSRENYIFKGWEYNGELITSNSIVTAEEDHTLLAIWELKGKTYIVKLINEDVIWKELEYNNGSTLGIIDYPSKLGHSFDGWYYINENNEEIKAEFGLVINSDLQLYSKWTINEYTITLVPNGGTLDQSSIVAEFESTIELPKPQKTGYEFEGWFIDSSFNNEFTSDIMVPYDITVYAKWKANVYTITFDTDGGTSIDPITQEYGTPITPPKDPEKSGYKFNGWDREIPATMPVGGITITATWTKESSGGGCFVAGTLITMADGTQKKVEDILPGDLLLVFNHETGQYDLAPVVFNDYEIAQTYTIINLHFSNGKNVNVVYEHGFFDLDLMKYVYIDEYNYNDYVGHRFYAQDGAIVTLDDAYLTEEYIEIYSPVTAYHLNYFIEGILSMPGGITGLFNIFEYGEDLSYNEESKQADIEKYGLFTYDDFKDYTSLEFYSAFPTAYLKVAIGKGLVTFEQILYYIERYQPKTE